MNEPANTDATGTGTDKPGWNEVETAERMRAEGAAQVEAAWKTERTRCLALIKTEIEEGLRRGIPQTSGTMLILYRLQSAIENG
jgi:hypothetical protein